MLIISFFAWWYGAGWRRVISGGLHRLARVAEFFSMGLLLKTLFSPFKQISAGGVRGGLNVQFRAFIDRLVSRFVGFFVRIGVLLAGIVSVGIIFIFRLIITLIWPLVPFLPLVLIVSFFVGVKLYAPSF